MFPVNEAGDTHPNKGDEPLRGFFIRAGSKNRQLYSLLDHITLAVHSPRAQPTLTPPTQVLSHISCPQVLCHYRKAPGQPGSHLDPSSC